MADLVRFDKDGIEVFVDTTTGESFASISGYARMANKDRSTISKRLTRDNIPLKSAEVPTDAGIRLVNLIDEKYIADNLPKDNPDMASKMIQVGVRIYLHGLAGYKYQPVAVSTPPSIDLSSFEDMFERCFNKSLKPQLERLEKYEDACIQHTGTGYVIHSEVIKGEYPDEVITTSEYCKQHGLDRSLWATFSKRYAQFVRVGTSKNPPKRNNKLLICQNLYYYADSAIKNVMALG